MIAAEIVAGVVLATQFSKYGSVLPNNVSIGVLVVICVFIAGFAWSWGVSHPPQYWAVTHMNSAAASGHKQSPHPAVQLHFPCMPAGSSAVLTVCVPCMHMPIT